MGAVYFYHLTRNPVDHTLAELLPRARQAGWRCLVRGQTVERMDWLDQKLWLGRDDDFLPHGLAGGPFDAEQPILLSFGQDNPNGASCVMAIDGADVTPDEVQASERVCILFDGHDADAVAVARSQWATLTGAGCEAQYWSEESGRWEMKAQHPK